MTGCSEQENDLICLYFNIFEDSNFHGHVSEVLKKSFKFYSFWGGGGGGGGDGSFEHQKLMFNLMD